MTDAPALQQKVRGKPFAPGDDPRRSPGRKPGVRNRVTLLAERLMDAEAESVITAVITAAQGGDMTAARMILDRVAALPRDRLVAFDPPTVNTAEDVAAAVAGVLQAVADGQLTPAEGAIVANILETRRKAIETVELERRLAELERGR